MAVAERELRAEPPARERPSPWSMASAAALHLALLVLLLGAGTADAPLRYAAVEFRVLPPAEDEASDEESRRFTDGGESFDTANIAAPPSPDLASGGPAFEPAVETAPAPAPQPPREAERKAAPSESPPPPVPRAKPAPPLSASTEAPAAPLPLAPDLFPPSFDAFDAASAAGGGERGSPDRSGSLYLSLVRAEIERQRLYPSAGQGASVQGTAVFALVVDRAGRLLVLELTRSSGAPLLDDAGAEMIRRAAPLPPLPPEIPGEAVELEVALRLFPL